MANDSPSNVPKSELRSIVDALLVSYREEPRAHHVGKRFIPDRKTILEILELLLELLYPGFTGKHDLDDDNLAYHVGERVALLREKLERQAECCLCHADETASHLDVPKCRMHGHEVTADFLAALPEIRRMLVLDVKAAVDGDPAASSVDEIILSYPGLYAITVHRIAHELFLLGVPLMPRIMSEHAHTVTGADIHPGARIGKSFFIDHATGVVVGETTVIGDRVRLYQGVTLGALSVPRDDLGNVIRGTKRHPTVENDVTIYANATVLGGETVLGRGAVVGGSAFVTKSVPPGHRAVMESINMRIEPIRDPNEPLEQN
jgi:serine O-acetyltransferase